jgi:hypothetical protein
MRFLGDAATFVGACSMLRSSIGRRPLGGPSQPVSDGAMFFEVLKGRLPGSMRQGRSSRADRFEIVYLRAAQAYMLISMPTGTSTILGVFQVISILRSNLARTPRRSRT